MPTYVSTQCKRCGHCYSYQGSPAIPVPCPQCLDPKTVRLRLIYSDDECPMKVLGYVESTNPEKDWERLRKLWRDFRAEKEVPRSFMSWLGFLGWDVVLDMKTLDVVLD